MPRRRRTLMRSALATIASIGLIAGVASWNSPQVTDAAWSDSEHASGSATALTLAPPQITSAVCTKAVLGLLLNRLEMKWQWPASQPLPGSSLAPVWSINGTVMATQPTTTGPDASGTYTTTFSSGLLTELVTLLLGGNATITVRAQIPGTGPPVWQSATGSTVNLHVPPLLGSPTCPWVNG